MRTRIVLVGAGHAHVEVIRRFGLADRTNLELVLISDSPRTGYSGMMPGVIAGHYTRDQAEINVARLCAQSGVRFVAASVHRIDATNKRIETEGGVESFDWLSINAGSRPTMMPVTGGLHLTVKPFGDFLSTFHTLDEKRNVAIVGGGAASVEVLLALAYRARTRGQPTTFTLISASETLLPMYPVSVQNAAKRAFRTYGAIFRGNAQITKCLEEGLELKTGEVVACDASVWATSAAPNAFIGRSDLAKADDGFILVDAFQRSISHPHVFAVGDCASRRDHPLPKAGVVPVKQGPWLFEALSTVANGAAIAAPFGFQKNALALLALGEKRAAGFRGNLHFSGAWVWHWKDAIDRRFMRRY